VIAVYLHSKTQQHSDNSIGCSLYERDWLCDHAAWKRNGKSEITADDLSDAFQLLVKRL
jgi:hypothetical protein